MLSLIPRFSLVLLVLVAVVVVLRRERPLLHPAARAAAAGPGVVVIDRHLARADWYRRFGAWAGFAIAVEVGIVWYGRVGFGVGDTSVLGDVLAMPMLGSLVGTIAAETYHLHHGVAAPRIADLTDRRGRFRSADMTRKMRIWSGVAVLATGAAAVHTGYLLLLVAAIAVPLVVEATARSVETRSRPALSSGVEAADDSIRRWATERLDRSGYAIAVLLAGWGLLGSGFIAPFSSVVPLALVIGWGAIIASFRIWRSIGRIPA
jgi:hypothetical protein